MFKKFLASMGKGAAKVDLQLAQSTYQAGEQVTGTVHVFGGEVDQNINRIDVYLYMGIRNDHEIKPHHIESIPVQGRFTIRSNEQKQIPFSYVLPYTLPLTSPSVSFYFDTHLDISGGVDKSDTDFVKILPDAGVQNIFHAFENLGFRQNSDSGKLDRYGQEFSFYPNQNLSREIEEVEIRFAVENQGVRLWLETDVRKSFGREQEMKTELFLDTNVLGNVQNIMHEIERSIEELVQQSGSSHATSYQSYSNNHQGHSSHLHNHHHNHERSHHQGHSNMGMVGGIAAGVIGGLLIDDVIDSFTGGDDNNDDGGGLFGDFFGGDSDDE